MGFLETHPVIVNTDLSAKGKKAGVTGLANLTAIITKVLIFHKSSQYHTRTNMIFVLYCDEEGGIRLIKEERTVCYDKDLKIEAYWFKGIMQKFPNHFHEYYVIGYIESGQRYLSCKSNEYIVGPGDIVLFNPLDNHTCEQIDDLTLDYRCLNIKTEVMEEVVKEITGKVYLPVFTQTVVFRSDYANLLRELHSSVMEEQRDFKKEETFLFLIEMLIKEYTKEYQQENSQTLDKPIDLQIQTVCDYIVEHYTEGISLEVLSSVSNMNKYSFLRCFAKQMGITPYRYLETVRINKSKQLLETGVSPVDAAIRSGFTDQSHFTNNFKEYIGLTPKQYQNIFTCENRD